MRLVLSWYCRVSSFSLPSASASKTALASNISWSLLTMYPARSSSSTSAVIVPRWLMPVPELVGANRLSAIWQATPPKGQERTRRGRANWPFWRARGRSTPDGTDGKGELKGHAQSNLSLIGKKEDGDLTFCALFLRCPLKFAATAKTRTCFGASWAAGASTVQNPAAPVQNPAA